jgi:MSHA biogenesis protein MshG
MATFQYKGRNQKGQTVSGTAEAQSSQAVAEELMKKRITPIDIKLTKKTTDASSTYEKFMRSSLMVKPVKPEELIIFCRQVNTLLKAGVPILTVLKKLHEMSQSKLLKIALTDIANDVAAGQTLATAISKHPRIFSPVFINLVNTGESSGQLDQAFIQMGNYIQLEADTRKRVKKATRYPTIVMVVLAVAVIALNIFVIPAFKEMFESLGTDLPLPTRILLGMSGMMLNYWPALLAGIAGIFFGTKILLKKSKQVRYYWDLSKLRLPLFGNIILRVTLARFSRTLTMVSKAGVPINKALTLVAEASENTFVSAQVFAMRDQVERGASLYVAASSAKLFTPLVLQMLEIGEQTGMIDEMLEEVATAYEEEVDYDLAQLGDLIEPVLLAVLGAMVGLLMLGIFMPMWGMLSAFKS